LGTPASAVVARLARHTTAWVLDDFVRGDHGKAYGITAPDRRRLVGRFDRTNRAIPSGTSTALQVVLAREILAVPPATEGDVVECGCWKGASSANLSLACGLVGRRLVVCDSFQGLPEEGLRVHTAPHAGIYGYYRKGMFEGSLEEVRHNVARHGEVGRCEFVPGFFSESLRSLARPIAMAFLDVDLASSTCDCLRSIWPLLVEGGAVYTDDAGDLDCVRPFFDQAWWDENLGCPAPGFVGSGCGLPMNPWYSSLGYARKQTAFRPDQWRKAAHLYYPAQEVA